MKEVVIYPNKRSLWGALAAATGFVAIGLVFLLSPEVFENPVFATEWLVRLLGLISVSFFGFCGVVIGQRIRSPKPALRITEEGIYEDSSALGVGFIPWEDIENVYRDDFLGNSYLAIELKDAEAYIAKGKNKAIRATMRANAKMCGTPISIATNSLKIDADDLEYLIEREVYKRLMP
ncbi:MAG: STM3941 family protein [Bacteroidota bacterium]